MLGDVDTIRIAIGIDEIMAPVGGKEEPNAGHTPMSEEILEGSPPHQATGEATAVAVEADVLATDRYNAGQPDPPVAAIEERRIDHIERGGKPYRSVEPRQYDRGWICRGERYLGECSKTLRGDLPLDGYTSLDWEAQRPTSLSDRRSNSLRLGKHVPTRTAQKDSYAEDDATDAYAPCGRLISLGKLCRTPIAFAAAPFDQLLHRYLGRAQTSQTAEPRSECPSTDI